MEHFESVQFQLPPHVIASLNEAVRSGEYHSTNEAAAAAIAQWQLRRKIMLEELRMLIAEGDASPDAPEETLEEFLKAARTRHLKS